MDEHEMCLHTSHMKARAAQHTRSRYSALKVEITSEMTKENSLRFENVLKIHSKLIMAQK